MLNTIWSGLSGANIGTNQPSYTAIAIIIIFSIANHVKKYIIYPKLDLFIIKEYLLRFAFVKSVLKYPY